jgi:hypothetical protein
VVRDPADGPAGTDLEIEPGRSVVLSAILAPPEPANCPGVVNIKGISLTDFEPVTVDEISSGGEKLESLALAIDPVSLVPGYLRVSNSLPRTPDPFRCAWKPNL